MAHTNITTYTVLSSELTRVKPELNGRIIRKASVHSRGN